MRTLARLGLTLTLSLSLPFALVRDARAAPPLTPQALREKAVHLVALRRDRLEKPSFQRHERVLLYSLGRVPLPTELTGSVGVAVLLQAQMEIEWLREYTRTDVLLELAWAPALREADGAVGEGLRTLSGRRMHPSARLAHGNRVREHVRGEVLLRPLRSLLAHLDHEHPGGPPHVLREKGDAKAFFIPSVRLVVTPAGATVRYCSEWDWELWKLLGEDPRTKMLSVSTAEPVRLDGTYYFELTAPGAPSPLVIGPRGVDPASGTVTLP